MTLTCQATTAAEFEAREALVNPALDWLTEMQPEEFGAVFRGSPVRRAKLYGLRRNAVIAMGNSGNKIYADAKETSRGFGPGGCGTRALGVGDT